MKKFKELTERYGQFIYGFSFGFICGSIYAVYELVKKGVILP